MLESLCRQPAALLQRHAAGRQHLADTPVVIRVNDDHHVRVVLGRGAEHGRAADVDVLQRVVERGFGPGDRLPERVQVADDDVDRRYAMFPELRHVVRV